MASLCRQIVRVNACRNLILSTARRGYADKMMPDPMEHATGLEKKELLALQSGNDDPFNMKVLKKSAGTRDNPTLVPSCFDAALWAVYAKNTPQLSTGCGYIRVTHVAASAVTGTN